MKYNVLEFMSNIEKGGVQNIVFQYANFINRNKFSMHICCLFAFKKNNSFYKALLSKKIKTKSLLRIIKKWDTTILVRIFKKFFSKYYICSKLKKIINKENINVLHVHSDVLQYIAFISNFLKIKNVKIFYTCHGNPNHDIGEKNIDENLAIKTLLKYDKFTICALHKQMQIEIMEMLNTKKVILLENGIDFAPFKQNNSTKIELREKFGIPQKAMVIGCVARFHDIKNLIFLSDVLKECLYLNKNSFMIIAARGNKNYKKRLIQSLKLTNVYNYCLIMENRDDINDVFKMFDVFVLPSKYESFGLSIIEAQLSNLNCIYSDVISKEINFNSNNIALSIYDTPKRWAKALVEASAKEPNVNNEGIEKFNIKNVIKKVELLYSNTII